MLIELIMINKELHARTPARSLIQHCGGVGDTCFGSCLSQLCLTERFNGSLLNTRPRFTDSSI